MKALLASAFAITAVAAQLSAGTVSVTFNSANGQKDSSGYYISPYNATVAGVSTTIYCDDFANHVTPGQQYFANQTNLGSGDLSLTRYGSSSVTLQTQAGTQTYNGQQLYDMAAWLTTQFTPNGASNGDVQDTLWDLFSPAANGGVNKAPTPSSNNMLFAAEQNYASINPANFTILTNQNATLTGSNQVQEFILPVSQSPEPASLGLLGLGLMLLSFFGRRKLFPGRAN